MLRGYFILGKKFFSKPDDMTNFYAVLSTQSKTDPVAKALDQCKDIELCEARVPTSSFPIQYKIFIFLNFIINLKPY